MLWQNSSQHCLVGSPKMSKTCVSETKAVDLEKNFVTESSNSINILKEDYICQVRPAQKEVSSVNDEDNEAANSINQSNPGERWKVKDDIRMFQIFKSMIIKEECSIQTFLGPLSSVLKSQKEFIKELIDK